MIENRFLPLLLIIGICSLPAWTAADNLRCGTQLVKRGDLAIQVKDKCGEPNSQEVIGYTLKGSRHRHAFREREYVIEQWIYGPRRGFYQEIIFEAGRVHRINQIKE